MKDNKNPINKRWKDYFRKYLRIAPVSHSLWRAHEAFEMSKIEIIRPILDVGCGFGEFASVFFNEKPDCGLDISEKEISKANKCGKYKKLVVGDACSMPFADKSYATLISISVLEHIDNAEQALAEAYRVLKRGGKFVFTVPTSELNGCMLGKHGSYGKNISPDVFTKVLHKAFFHKNIWPVGKWKKAIVKAGFKNPIIRPSISHQGVAKWRQSMLEAVPSYLYRKLTGDRKVSRKKDEIESILEKFNDHPVVSDCFANIIVIAEKE